MVSQPVGLGVTIVQRVYLSLPCCSGNELEECAAQSGEPGGCEMLDPRSRDMTRVEVAEVPDVTHPEIVQYKGVDTRETHDFVECVVS